MVAFDPLGPFLAPEVAHQRRIQRYQGGQLAKQQPIARVDPESNPRPMAPGD